MSQTKIHTYPKSEKLKSKTTIDLMFREGKSVSKYPLRLVYAKSTFGENPEFKMGVSVSKKYFKKAVHRNRIKRLLRESYRLNKDLFKEAFGDKTIAMLFWTSSEIPEKFQNVEEQFIKLCQAQKKP